MRKQVKRSSKEWEELVKEFRSFEGGKNKFCMQKGINYHSFRLWHDKLGRSAERQKNENIPSFVKLEPLKQSKGCIKTSEMRVKITLAGGIGLEIVTDDIVQLVRELNNAI